MGIDTRILIRVKPPHLTPPEIERVSYALSSCIGADHFWLQKAEFKEGKFVPGRTALCEILPETEEYYPEDKGKVVFRQDGDSIYPEPDEQFLELHLWSRYYGPGYARGNWMVLRTTFQLLARLLPGAEIWYGGDSSGVLAEPVMIRGQPTPWFEKIDNCWFDSGRESYTHTGRMWLSKGESLICPTCNHHCANIGGGGSKTFYYCYGCETNYVTSQGKVWRGEESFKIAEEIREGKTEPYFDGKDFPQFFRKES